MKSASSPRSAGVPLAGPRQVGPLLWGLAGLMVIGLVWQIAGAAGAIASGAVPPLSDVLASLAEALATPSFWPSLAATVWVAALGFATALAIGVPLGVALGSVPVLWAIARGPVEFLKPIPPIVIIPLAILLLGPTTRMSWALITFGCVFPIVAQTVDGTRDTDSVVMATARSYRLDRRTVWLSVLLPSAMPFIATAVRITAPTALIVAVVAGLVGGAPGLGSDLRLAQAAGATERVYSLVIAMGVLGLLVQALTTAVERRVLHWHSSIRLEG